MEAAHKTEIAAESVVCTALCVVLVVADNGLCGNLCLMGLSLIHIYEMLKLRAGHLIQPGGKVVELIEVFIFAKERADLMNGAVIIRDKPFLICLLYTSPVEHMMIERVKQNKSLVDVMLISRTCQEHYKNNVDSFILVSSDSDYWGLISSLQDARSEEHTSELQSQR